MKNLLAAFLILLFGANLSAQDLAGATNTFVTFDLILDKDLLDKLDPYSPTTSREKENFMEAKQYLEQKLLNNLHSMISDGLAEADIETAPMNTLEDYKITYNRYGYPNTLIAKSVVKKARKNGYESDHFIVVKSTIGSASDILGSAKLARQVKDEVKITCNILDAEGKKVNSAEGKFKASTPKKAKSFPSGKFDKMEVEYMDELLEILKPSMQNAVDKLLENLI